MNPDLPGVHRFKVTCREHVRKGPNPILQYRYQRPCITLSAKWLADAGFREGDTIFVYAAPGLLVIEKQ